MRDWTDELEMARHGASIALRMGGCASLPLLQYAFARLQGAWERSRREQRPVTLEEALRDFAAARQKARTAEAELGQALAELWRAELRLREELERHVGEGQNE